MNYNALAITPKISKTSGFTNHPNTDRGIIAGHVLAFMNKGGVIDVLTTEWENNLKARIGFNSYSGHMEA